MEVRSWSRWTQCSWSVSAELERSASKHALSLRGHYGCCSHNSCSCLACILSRSYARMQSRIGDWDAPRIPAEDVRVKRVPAMPGDCHAEQTRVFRTIMKGRFEGQTTLLFVFSVEGGRGGKKATKLEVGAPSRSFAAAPRRMAN